MAEHKIHFSRSEGHLENHPEAPYQTHPEYIEVTVRGWVGMTYEFLRIDPDIYSSDHLAAWNGDGSWEIISDALADQGLHKGHVFSDITVIDDFGNEDESIKSLQELGIARAEAKPGDVIHVLAQDTDGDDGRSDWEWFRLPNGDLILGCFPQGTTYFDVVDNTGV